MNLPYRVYYCEKCGINEVERPYRDPHPICIECRKLKNELKVLLEKYERTVKAVKTGPEDRGGLAKLKNHQAKVIKHVKIPWNYVEFDERGVLRLSESGLKKYLKK